MDRKKFLGLIIFLFLLFSTSGYCKIVKIAAGVAHTVVLRSDGKVVAWGRNEDGQCNVPEGLTNVVAIAAGGGHTAALLSNGMVAVWGSQYFVP